MKRQFKIHLDAVIALALVFALALGLNYYQYRQYQSLLAEYQSLQFHALADKFNLDSLRQHVARLEENAETVPPR